MGPRTLLLATARNEGPYLSEWLAYHRAIGFDGVLLVTNSNTDGSDSLIAALAKAGVVSHIDNSTLEGTEDFSRSEKENIQIRAYTRALRSQFFHAFDWVCIIDLDEFLVFKRHDSIQEFLEGQDADGVAINWLNFGSSGRQHYEDGLVIDRFTRCAPVDWRWNAYIKSISRVKSIRKLAGAHYSFLLPGKDKFVYCSGNAMTSYHDENNIDFSVAQINHYVVKSHDEFGTERSRGDGISNPSLDAAGRKYTEEYFRIHDRNEREDRSIARFRDRTLAQLAYLMSIESVAVAHRACVADLQDRIARNREAAEAKT
jgi:hypothetical protein